MMNKSTRILSAAAGLWMMAGLAFSTTAGAAVHDVQFAPGAERAKVSGSITGKNDNTYRVRAREGQTMTVKMKAQRGTTYFNINPAGSDQAIFIGSNEGAVFDGRLPATGVYEIIVYQMGAAASDNKTSKYDLNIAISGGQGAGAAGGTTFSAGQTVEIVGVRSNALDALELRDGPGRGGATARVGNGRLMKVDNCEQDWCHVRAFNDASVAGWVETRYLRSK